MAEIAAEMAMTEATARTTGVTARITRASAEMTIIIVQRVKIIIAAVTPATGTGPGTRICFAGLKVEFRIVIKV